MVFHSFTDLRCDYGEVDLSPHDKSCRPFVIKTFIELEIVESPSLGLDDGFTLEGMPLHHPRRLVYLIIVFRPLDISTVGHSMVCRSWTKRGFSVGPEA